MQMSNKAFSLPQVLKWTFTILEVILCLSTVQILGSFIFGTAKHLSGQWVLGFIGLRIDPSAYHLGSSAIPSGALSMHDFFGSLSVNFPEANPYFQHLLWPLGGIIFCKTVTLIALCDLFRRMFRSVARGEVFSSSNIRLLHKVGALIVLLTLAGAGFGHWFGVYTWTFVEKNIELHGAMTIEMRPPPAEGMSWGAYSIHGVYVRIDENQLVIGPIWIDIRPILLGLVLIGLGEALRQGKVLKEESELTV